MRRRRILYAALDGGANWLLLTGVTICVLAEKTAWISLAWMIALSAAAAVISTVWYGRLLMRIKNDGRKAMLCFTYGKHFELFGLRCD